MSGTDTQRHGPSREARRLAIVILEVLAGMRTPTEAAQCLSVAVPRYYALEQRAVENLVVGCEPRPRGGVKGSQRRIAELEGEVKRLRQQCDRHLALARAAQRTVDLSMPAKTAAGGKTKGNSRTSSGKKSGKRRPTVRALKAAKVLRDAQLDKTAPTSSDAEAVSATVCL